MGMFYKTLFATAAITFGTVACSRNPERVAPVTDSAPVQVQPVPKDTLPNTYTVQNGDYLWGISYRELGTRGDSAITAGVKQIQNLSNLSLDGDTHMVVNRELVPGKDGLVDLIYSGQALTIR